MTTNDIEIRHTNPRLAQLEADYETWATGVLDQVYAAGGTTEDAVDTLTMKTPPAFMPVVFYDAAYRMAVEICDAQASAGQLVKLSGGGYVDPTGVDRDAAAHIAEEVLRRLGMLDGGK